MAADGVKARRPRIAIAGASGFVGRALRERRTKQRNIKPDDHGHAFQHKMTDGRIVAVYDPVVIEIHEMDDAFPEESGVQWSPVRLMIESIELKTCTTSGRLDRSCERRLS